MVQTGVVLEFGSPEVGTRVVCVCLCLCARRGMLGSGAAASTQLRSLRATFPLFSMGSQVPGKGARSGATRPRPNI